MRRVTFTFHLSRRTRCRRVADKIVTGIVERIDNVVWTSRTWNETKFQYCNGEVTWFSKRCLVLLELNSLGTVSFDFSFISSSSQRKRRHFLCEEINVKHNVWTSRNAAIIFHLCKDHSFELKYSPMGIFYIYQNRFYHRPWNAVHNSCFSFSA